MLQILTEQNVQRSLKELRRTTSCCSRTWAASASSILRAMTAP
jgi:hypothetical protein